MPKLDTKDEQVLVTPSKHMSEKPLRLLALQNLYPPDGPGGCGIAAREVLLRLEARGHKILVLTSRYGSLQPRVERSVARVLHTYAWSFVPRTTGPLNCEVQNQRMLRAILKSHQPDVALIWSMSGLPLSLLAELNRRDIPIFYYMHDHWLLYWTDPWQAFWQRRRRGWRRVLGHVPGRSIGSAIGCGIAHNAEGQLRSQWAFVSEARKAEYREAGFDVVDGPVITNGVDSERFSPIVRERATKRTLQLLFVGNLVFDKGIHTALEALARLGSECPTMDVRLTVVGPKLDAQYYEDLLALVSRLEIESQVEFRGEISQDAIASLYQYHDILLLPSIVPEGLPLVLLEAMACGLPAITTNTGGQTEVVDHMQNGFIVAPERPEELSHYIALLADPELRQTMSKSARRHVAKRYEWSLVVEQIEKLLYALVRNETTP